MAGIVAALEAHDDVGLLRQPVDDLALPFVAPLGADDDNIGHLAGIPLCNHLHTSMISPETRFSPPDQVEGMLFLIMRPALITAGAARMRRTPPDKGSGLLTQARTGLLEGVKQVQPIDIP